MKLASFRHGIITAHCSGQFTRKMGTGIGLRLRGTITITNYRRRYRNRNRSS
jgi:hypothetical protein